MHIKFEKGNQTSISRAFKCTYSNYRFWTAHLPSTYRLWCKYTKWSNGHFKIWYVIREHVWKLLTCWFVSHSRFAYVFRRYSIPIVSLCKRFPIGFFLHSAQWIFYSHPSRKWSSLSRVWKFPVLFRLQCFYASLCWPITDGQKLQWIWDMKSLENQQF